MNFVVGLTHAMGVTILQVFGMIIFFTITLALYWVKSDHLNRKYWKIGC